MTQVMEQLLSLQKVQLHASPSSPPDESIVAGLRSNIPEPVLAHFDRFIARGKKGVGIARNGVCSECHLQIPSGTLADLACTSEIHLCDNCGRYLYLPENEPLGITRATPPKKRAGRGRKESTTATS